MLWKNSSAVAAAVLATKGRPHASRSPGAARMLHIVPGPSACFTHVQKTDIVSFYVFVTNGVKIKDGELPGTSNETKFRYASIRF